MPTEVTLGDVTVPVYPARWRYIENRLGDVMTALVERGEGIEADAILSYVGEGAYDLLTALIPNLAKRLTREEYMDEETCPTVPEIRAAIRVALEVNELSDLPGMVGKALGPAGVNYLRADLLQKMVSGDSPSSPAESGDSQPTSSGPTSPTSTENEGSPTPVSPS
ncbi:MAG TPA: hypothetical protein VFG23_12855 [Polyangia bacterium]|nr:hypothetical protein [Polyangia bacterium]